jgi:hypothetical protein
MTASPVLCLAEAVAVGPGRTPIRHAPLPPPHQALESRRGRTLHLLAAYSTLLPSISKAIPRFQQAAPVLHVFTTQQTPSGSFFYIQGYT